MELVETLSCSLPLLSHLAKIFCKNEKTEADRSNNPKWKSIRASRSTDTHCFCLDLLAPKVILILESFLREVVSMRPSFSISDLFPMWGTKEREGIPKILNWRPMVSSFRTFHRQFRTIDAQKKRRFAESGNLDSAPFDYSLSKNPEHSQWRGRASLTSVIQRVHSQNPGIQVSTFPQYVMTINLFALN